jgi:hypothetical protein
VGAVAFPQSLIELVPFAGNVEQWQGGLRNFLDAFYYAPQENRCSMIEQEPPCTDSAYFNAYMAGVAEYLAREYGLPIPEWVHDTARFMHTPKFPCELEGMKAYLLSSTPSAFNRRMIFTGDNPLTRPSKFFTNSFLKKECAWSNDENVIDERRHALGPTPF